MRDLVFNDACLDVPFATVGHAVAATSRCIKGIKNLIADDVVRRAIRLPGNAHDIKLGNQFSLFDVVVAILKQPELKDHGSLFLSLLQLTPIDVGVSDETINQMLACKIQDKPNWWGLLLCALSNGVAVSIDPNDAWDFNTIELSLQYFDASGSSVTKKETIDHLSKEGHAAPIVQRHKKKLGKALKQDQFWDQKDHLFPSLLFGLDVRDHIKGLGPEPFSAAIDRLFELDASSNRWNKAREAKPKYASKVSGESRKTMQQYGEFRIFRNSEGKNSTFELHARIADGHRIHIIEHEVRRQIEVGYIGHHLPTAKYPD